jgi:hypothetical protein
MARQLFIIHKQDISLVKSSKADNMAYFFSIAEPDPKVTELEPEPYRDATAVSSNHLHFTIYSTVGI